MNTKITRSMSYGVYVMTAMDGDRPCGCTANSAMQITSEPPTVAVSINHNNYTNELIKKTGKVAVNILAEDSAPSIIGTFGFKSGRDNDKFEGIDYEMRDGLPVIKDSIGYMCLQVKETVETSTHTVFIGEITDADVFNNRTPMTYAYYHAVVKGKTPKNAPTYVADEDPAADAAPAPATPAPEAPAQEGPKKVWVCTLCGYEYEGDVPFEELPDDWTCPLCGAPKSCFELREK